MVALCNTIQHEFPHICSTQPNGFSDWEMISCSADGTPVSHFCGSVLHNPSLQQLTSILSKYVPVEQPRFQPNATNYTLPDASRKEHQSGETTVIRQQMSKKQRISTVLYIVICIALFLSGGVIFGINIVRRSFNEGALSAARYSTAGFFPELLCLLVGAGFFFAFAHANNKLFALIASGLIAVRQIINLACCTDLYGCGMLLAALSFWMLVLFEYLNRHNGAVKLPFLTVLLPIILLIAGSFLPDLGKYSDPPILIGSIFMILFFYKLKYEPIPIKQSR